MKRILSMAVLSLACTFGAQAADHLDSPSVQENGALDLTDLFAFQSPANSENAVLIMGVNPGAGAISGTTFDNKGLYAFNIDNNGDQQADISYVLRFFRAGRRGQSYAAYRLSNSENARSGKRRGSKRRSRVKFIGFGRTGNGPTQLRGGGMLQAGLFEDPFFFDLNGFNNGFAFTGDDFFAGLNISGIVLEIPRSDLNGDAVSVWATTSTRSGQFDRTGRPAISTALIGSDRKNEYNLGHPANDFSAFGDDVEATITTLNGGDVATAQALTAILLPDVLTVDFSSTAGFLNGRQLADDVLDAELNLLTNGAITTDGVDTNDAIFGDSFPYLAPSN